MAALGEPAPLTGSDVTGGAAAPRLLREHQVEVERLQVIHKKWLIFF